MRLIQMGVDEMTLKSLGQDGIQLIEDEPEEEVLLVTTIKN